MSKAVPQLDLDGYYLGPARAQPDPLTPGAWLIPAGAVDAPLPDVPAGHLARWAGADWAYEAITLPAPSPAEVAARIVAEVQSRLDAFAAERGYDGILSACTYADSAVPQFALEGAACVALRDATWAALYALQAQVIAGARPVPASLTEILSDLPALVWPDAPSPSPEA